VFSFQGREEERKRRREEEKKRRREEEFAGFRCSVFREEKKRKEKTGVLGLLEAAGVNAADEALEHGGDFAGFFDHLAGAGDRFLIERFLDSFADVELCSKFTAGAFADAEEADEITVAITLGSFCDIRRNGYGRTLHLILEPVVLHGVCRNTNVHRELAPAFPNFQILKGSDSHGLLFLPEN
jgi:hypothetical protein